MERTEIVSELVALQRQRTIIIKSRIMQANRLQAILAGTIGYSTGLSEEDRRKKFSEAGKLIQAITKGQVDHPLKEIVLVTMEGINAFEAKNKDLKKRMEEVVSLLPIAKWAEEEEQKGFGLCSLAQIIGEAGDLANYSGPKKLWKRMGCLPYCYNGVTQMGSTWRMKKGLPAGEWTQFGYSPRRRAVAYVIGVSLIKGNYLGKEPVTEEDDNLEEETSSRKPGPYRQRYLEVKQHAFENRPDWTTCSKCLGVGSTQSRTKKSVRCGNCKGTGKVAKRCHYHAMLLTIKLLLKNLWIEWNGHPPMPDWTQDKEKEETTESSTVSRRKNSYPYLGEEKEEKEEKPIKGKSRKASAKI